MTNWKHILGAGALTLALSTPALAQVDYSAWDADGDGLWSADEFGTGFGERIGAYDTDGDGMLNQDEFNAGLFAGYDLDRDGYLSEDERTAFEESDGLGFWDGNDGLGNTDVGGDADDDANLELDE